MRARRTFDEKFKRQVVESVLSGSVSQEAPGGMTILSHLMES